MKKMKSIVIIIDYFNTNWPVWIDAFLLSCEYNQTINWIIHTNCPFKKHNIMNVTIKYLTWEDYCLYASNKLNINFQPQSPYKICDLKPAFGYLWYDEIQLFDFWGYGDIDIIYGSLRDFLTVGILKKNVISTHEWCFSGHLCILKNKRWLITVFMKVANWKQILSNPTCMRFDEDYLISYFVKPNWQTKKELRWIVFLYDRLNPFRIKYRNIHLMEYWTTPFIPTNWINDSTEHPTLWYWVNGRVYNNLDNDKYFIYLHLMNYANASYISPKYKETIPWKCNQSLTFNTYDQLRKGFSISSSGIKEL
jgi:hypothetical protein